MSQAFSLVYLSSFVLWCQIIYLIFVFDKKRRKFPSSVMFFRKKRSFFSGSIFFFSLTSQKMGFNGLWSRILIFWTSTKDIFTPARFFKMSGYCNIKLELLLLASLWRIFLWKCISVFHKKNIGSYHLVHQMEHSILILIFCKLGF